MSTENQTQPKSEEPATDNTNTEPSATDFITNFRNYEATSIVSHITELTQELNDEKQLKDVLGNPDELKNQAIQFHDNYGPMIKNQAAQIKQISQELKVLVLENNINIAKNEDVVNLLTSEPYRDISNDINQIDKDIESSYEFLKIHNRRGRKHPSYTKL